MDKMNKWTIWPLSKYVVKWILIMITLVVSTISIFMDAGDVWKAVFCLALLNIVDLSEKEI